MSSYAIKWKKVNFLFAVTSLSPCKENWWELVSNDALLLFQAKCQSLFRIESLLFAQHFNEELLTPEVYRFAKANSLAWLPLISFFTEFPGNSFLVTSCSI